MLEEKSRWLSIGQAAKYLGLSRDTLRRWEKRGKVKAIRSPTNRRYYTQKLLDEVISGKKEIEVGRAVKPSLSGQKQKLFSLLILGVLSFTATILLILILRLLLVGQS